MDNRDSTRGSGQINFEALSNFAEETANGNSATGTETPKPAPVQTSIREGAIRLVIAEDVLCQACRSQFRSQTVGVRLGVAGVHPAAASRLPSGTSRPPSDTFDGAYLAFCAYHAGELLARLLACRGRF